MYRLVTIPNSLKRKILPVVALFMTMMLFSIVGTQRVMAQAGEWGSPVKIYETDNWIDWPILIGDASGRLHLIWNEQILENGEPTGESTIFYMVKEGDSWSEPVDILVPGNTYLDGFVDEFGRVHLVLSSLRSPVFFTQAQAAGAQAAPLWLRPLPLSNTQQTSASIARDATGKIHIVYAGTGPIAHLTSSDSGMSWTEPSQTGPALPSGQAVGGGSTILATGPDGALYLAWTVGELPGGYPPIRSEFSYSTDGGESWSDPVEIAPADYELVALTVGEDGWIHTLDVGRAGVGGRYHRWSSDGGRTWSPRIQITTPEEGTGLSGGDLAVDSAGGLHAVFGLDEKGDVRRDTMVAYSYWNGNSWSPWVDISSGLPAHLERMSIEVTEGNRLHATWALYGEQYGLPNSIWYVEGRANAPDVAPIDYVPLPAPSPTPSPPVSEATATSSPVPYLAGTDFADRDSQPQSQVIGLLAGFVSSVLVIGLVLIWHQTIRRR